MGKKVSQGSLKISKNGKQLHSLIKFLRPKVYITDSSSFKRLVQELTGNLSSITNSPAPTKPTDLVKRVQSSNTEDLQEPESSIEGSSFASLVSPDDQLCHRETLREEEFNQVSNQMILDDLTFEISTRNNPVDLFAYQDLESCLFGIDQPYPFYNDLAQIEQGVSIYDYELFGLI